MNCSIRSALCLKEKKRRGVEKPHERIEEEKLILLYQLGFLCFFFLSLLTTLPMKNANHVGVNRFPCVI